MGGHPTKTHRMRRPPHKTRITLRSRAGGPSGTGAGPHACPGRGRSLRERPLTRGPACGDGPLPQSVVTPRVARAAVTHGTGATLQGAPLAGMWLQFCVWALVLQRADPLRSQVGRPPATPTKTGPPSWGRLPYRNHKKFLGRPPRPAPPFPVSARAPYVGCPW